MTPEQFVFWISGYFKGGRDNDLENIVEDIQKALKEVKVNLGSTIVFGTE